MCPPLPSNSDHQDDITCFGGFQAKPFICHTGEKIQSEIETFRYPAEPFLCFKAVLRYKVTFPIIIIINMFIIIYIAA